MSGLADTVGADRHPKSCSRWFASDATTGEAICDCGLAEESTVEGLYQHDLAAILRALGAGDHARGESAHMVVHDVVLPAIRTIAARQSLDVEDGIWLTKDLLADLVRGPYLRSLMEDFRAGRTDAEHVARWLMGDLAALAAQRQDALHPEGVPE